MMILALLLQAMLGLIPAPVEYTPGEGVCTSGRVGTVKCRSSFRKAAASLEDFQRQEAYRLTITPSGASIEALTKEGEFRARTTLEQLRASGDALPCCTIFDYPRFRHRGLMIDESRSFKGPEFLKKQMDAMALLKLNVLPLHLNDSAGWRIESPSYPALTEKASWRLGACYFDWLHGGCRFSTGDNPAAYGGFYTREQLRDLVSYAAARHITVIPEIEMPGHSMEVGHACPEVICTGPGGEPCTGSADLCPGSEETFRLLESVLGEVMEIFPSPIIHIGGDEASMKTWHNCPKCLRRMQEEGLTDPGELQGYMVRRIHGFIAGRGRRIEGWDEILDTGVPADAVIQSWRGNAGGIKASAAGHDVVMSPNTHCYFDYYQDLIRKEPRACGELVSLRFCYGYEPVCEGMDASHVLGVQANLWCEYIPTPSHAEYMLYPRLLALAETAWTPAAAKEWHGFRKRARAMQDVLRARDYNTFDLDTESDLARSGLQRYPDKHPLP